MFRVDDRKLLSRKRIETGHSCFDPPQNRSTNPVSIRTDKSASGAATDFRRHTSRDADSRSERRVLARKSPIGCGGQQGFKWFEPYGFRERLRDIFECPLFSTRRESRPILTSLRRKIGVGKICQCSYAEKSGERLRRIPDANAQRQSH